MHPFYLLHMPLKLIFYKADRKLIIMLSTLLMNILFVIAVHIIKLSWKFWYLLAFYIFF